MLKDMIRRSRPGRVWTLGRGAGSPRPAPPWRTDRKPCRSADARPPAESSPDIRTSPAAPAGLQTGEDTPTEAWWSGRFIHRCRRHIQTFSSSHWFWFQNQFSFITNRTSRSNAQLELQQRHKTVFINQSDFILILINYQTAATETPHDPFGQIKPSWRRHLESSSPPLRPIYRSSPASHRSSTETHTGSIDQDQYLTDWVSSFYQTMFYL